LDSTEVRLPSTAYNYGTGMSQTGCNYE